MMHIYYIEPDRN